jgi:uncharacterized protein YjiS (DUF1127 family)
MSCGSVTCTPAIPITIPAIRFVPAEWPVFPWRALARSAWTRVLRFAERREQRLALLELDDRLLADIGISRADAFAEARKLFWL